MRGGRSVGMKIRVGMAAGEVPEGGNVPVWEVVESGAGGEEKGR